MYKLTASDQILVEKEILTHKGIVQAYEKQSPRLAEYICKLLILDPAPRKMFCEAYRGTPTFRNIHSKIAIAVEEKKSLLRSMPGERISKLASLESNWQGHRVVWENLTSDTMAPLLPERIHLNDVLFRLWNDSSAYAREQLLLILQHARLLYGVWQAMKKIFKEAETRYDWEVYAILVERFDSQWRRLSTQNYAIITKADQAQKIAEMKSLESWNNRKKQRQQMIAELEQKKPLTEEEAAHIESLHKEQEEAKETKPISYREPSVVNWSKTQYINRYTRMDSSVKTREYLRRRALRTFRKLASDLPDAFPSAAAEMIVRTSENIGWQLIHGYERLWSRHMLPLLKIVEEAPHQAIVQWAYEKLKTKFRTEMQEISGDWLYRVSQSSRNFTRAIALDYLENVTGVERGLFHLHNYHKTIIAFLSLGSKMPSHSNEAIDYSIIYIRGASVSVPSDDSDATEQQSSSEAIVDALSLEELCILLKRGGKYRELGEHLINGTNSESPYESRFTLDFFTSLLEDSETFDLGAKNITKRYTGTDLRSSWYKQRLLSKLKKVRELALQLLQDPTMYAKEDDWTKFCIDILHHLRADAAIYEEAFRRLTSKDSNGVRLLDNRASVPLTFVRFLLLHPSATVFQKALSLIENGLYSLKEIGVPFLKTVATHREFKNYYQQKDAWRGEEYTGSYINDVFLLHLKDKKEAAYHSLVGQSVRRWLYNEFSLQEVGLDWCFARIEWWSREYKFVRDLVTRDVTFSELANFLPNLTRKNPTDNLHIRGAQQVAWFVYDKCLDAGSKKANFYKNLLLSRNPRYRLHKGIISALSADQVFPQEAFDLDWFLRWGKSKRTPIRAYAIDMARYEMAYWLSKESWDKLQATYAKPKTAFDLFRPLFTGFHDVEAAIIRAIYKPLEPKEHSKIDIKGNSIFQPEALYRYCFGRDDRPRNFALGVIKDFPDKYGRLENLLSLSDSSDPRVRQLVVEVLWKKYNQPATTPGWKPFKYSVVPFQLSRAVDPIRNEKIDPNTLNIGPEDVSSGKHYLGIGGPEIMNSEAVGSDNQLELHEFIRRILYTLPRSPAQRTALEQRQSSDKKKAPLTSSWRNKKTLVVAIRDFALQDRDFAEFILPILEEFQSIRGKMLYEACLSALVQIKHEHNL